MKLTDLWKDNNFVINESTVEQFNKWFEKDVKNTRYSTDEKILKEYVSKCIHENSSFENIYTVVTLINSFYSTRMGADDCFTLSKILYCNHTEIYKAIQSRKPKPGLVQNIIERQQELKQQDEETKRVAFSFTTKYFSILSRFYGYKDENIRETDKDLYPIYDSVVAKVLDYYFYVKTNKKSHVSSCKSKYKSNKDDKGYERYVEIINGLKTKPYKYLDNYLWTIGRLVSDKIIEKLKDKDKKTKRAKTPNEPSWFVLGKYNISLDELMKEIFDDKGGFMFKISKSDYVLGIKCPNAIWFKKYRKDLQPEMNQAVLDNGTAVGELACNRFPGGVRITAKPWEDTAITQTKSAISGNVPFIYEATLSTDTGEYCAVDILRNNNDGTWDIIEVKSTTRPHDYHIIDASFQRYVFTQCGVKIRNCFIMTLNPEYVHHGNLDLEQLFALHDVTADLQDIETVRHEIERIRAVLDGPELGIAISKVKCNRFYECGYKCHCWRNIPEYSVFDAFKGRAADEIYAEYGADLRNVPVELREQQMHKGDIEAFLDNIDVINKDVLREFTCRLKWPLYYLDYESIMPAVPMFDNSRAYQQICFQFSLHVQRTPGGELEHYEYLHNDPKTDPRPGLIKKLIETIGDSGSVIVYNQGFEQGRNSEMARDFPEYAEQLNAINDRMVDLLIPFRERGLYRPCQKGSASIKQTLPAFVPEMSYANLGIHNGTEASDQFMAFMTGKQTAEQTKEMMANLHEYCGQDTMAMVRLLDVIQGILAN